MKLTVSTLAFVVFLGAVNAETRTYNNLADCKKSENGNLISNRGDIAIGGDTAVYTDEEAGYDAYGDFDVLGISCVGEKLYSFPKKQCATAEKGARCLKYLGGS